MIKEPYDIYKNYYTGSISKLQKIRQQRGISKEKLCIATGISLTVIHNIEQNGDNYSPKILTIAKIAKYFNVKISDLYDFDYELIQIPNDELKIPNTTK